MLNGLLVAKLVNCTGTPVFKLRGILTGRKGIAGGFTVDPMTGEVRMNVVHTGMMVIVR